MKNWLTLLLILGCFSSAYSQDNPLLKYSQAITAAEMEEHISVLASEEFAGRGTGQRGLDLAAQYIKEQFMASGLNGASPSGDPYYQEFKLLKGGRMNVRIIVGTDTLNAEEHILVSGGINLVQNPAEVVFIGFGIDEAGYSDYTEIGDLTGKIAVFIDGEPQDSKGRYLLSSSYMPRYTDRGQTKAETAYAKGALQVIRIVRDEESIGKLISMNNRLRGRESLSLPEISQKETDQNTGMLHVGLTDGARLLHTSSGDLLKAVTKMNKGKSQSGQFTSQAMILDDGSDQYVMTQNVAAFLEGSDLKDEWIIVTAHYDHLGIRDGVIRYGADDNATGTAAVIEIAESFALMAADGIRPRRSILFLPVSAEEIGLLGSKYYVENPIYPLENTVAAVNMDMIGRTDKNHSENPLYVYIYVSDSADSELARLSSEAATKAAVDLSSEFRYKDGNSMSSGGSDHASFERKDIPVLYFYCGLHEDYHRPTDTWEKVEYGKLATISQVVFMSVLELANQTAD